MARSFGLPGNTGMKAHAFKMTGHAAGWNGKPKADTSNLSKACAKAYHTGYALGVEQRAAHDVKMAEEDAIEAATFQAAQAKAEAGGVITAQDLLPGFVFITRTGTRMMVTRMFLETINKRETVLVSAGKYCKAHDSYTAFRSKVISPSVITRIVDRKKVDLNVRRRAITDKARAS
jgi:hypothetical protein